MGARKVREKQPDTMIASVDDITFVMTLARGRVSKVTLPLDQGGTLDMPVSLLRSIVEMVDDVDGDNR